MKESMRDVIVSALENALPDDSQIDTSTLDRMADAVLAILETDDDA